MTIGFVFPGQGSQSVGMLQALAERHSAILNTFAEASEVLHYDLWQLVSAGPKDDLNSTERTQPAMLTAGVALWRVWQAENGKLPALLAGHSLGEYTALVCAGVLNFNDAVALVADRGRYMQAAVVPGAGAMAAILGLDVAPLTEVCAQASTADEIVTCANYNDPGQIVIAGHTAAVERAVAGAKTAGAKRAVMLPVSVPSHCPLMRPAAVELATRLKPLSFGTPVIPVLHNVNAASSVDREAIKEALIEQLYQPVRWVETVQSMARHGITTLVECGPGKVLTGLVKRIDRNLQGLAIEDPAAFDQALASTR